MEKNSVSSPAKKSYVKQTELPRFTLQDTLCISQSLYDNFAGKNAAPHQLALSLDMSPTSSAWESITGAAMAYGLTEGGSNAERINLTALGRRIVAPTIEGDDQKAKLEAILQPRIVREFLQRYNKAKFPADKIALNVLAEMGVPQDRVINALEIIKKNGEYAGIIISTKTGLFVALEGMQSPSNKIESEKKPEDQEVEGQASSVDEIKEIPKSKTTNQRVFITHGKNKEIVGQLKELLVFGKFQPIVAEEHETTSKPVPDKVLDDMRTCFAGIIHIEDEEPLLDTQGNQRHLLNQNVLIEIGAALALYGRNVILIVRKGVSLPSNLQGLYLCFYDGDKLDYEATMKILKAFNEFQ